MGNNRVSEFYNDHSPNWLLIGVIKVIIFNIVVFLKSKASLEPKMHLFVTVAAFGIALWGHSRRVRKIEFNDSKLTVFRTYRKKVFLLGSYKIIGEKASSGGKVRNKYIELYQPNGKVALLINRDKFMDFNIILNLLSENKSLKQIHN